MPTLTPEQLQAIARHGAGARIKELEAEIAAIRETFTDIPAPARRGRPPGVKNKPKPSAPKKAKG